MLVSRGVCLFFLCFWLGACMGDKHDPVVPVALEPTATFMPTPTLALALVTAVPPSDMLERPSVAPESRDTTPATATQPPPTSTPSPTPSLHPEEHIALGQVYWQQGNVSAAIEQFEVALHQREALTVLQLPDLLLSLGIAYKANGRLTEASNTFYDLLAADTAPSDVYFHLAEVSERLGDIPAAINAYETYVTLNPEMAAYIYPRMAVLLEGESAIAAYEVALHGPAHRLVVVDIRRRLAQLYLNDARYDDAIAQYDAIRDIAITEYTRGEMMYLAGVTELLAGREEAAYERYLMGVELYPRAYETYLGLVALVEADYAVDDFQRGLIDYYAGAYEPAIAAFHRYIEANPDSVDAYLYLIWSYKALGNFAAAVTEIENYGRLAPAGALTEQADLLADTGNTMGAIEAYLRYVESYPDGEFAPLAAWRAAALTEQLGDTATAVMLYQHLADSYSWHEDAPEALFRAGWLAYQAGDVSMAVLIWQRVVKAYPTSEYQAAALIWLLKTIPTLDITQTDAESVALLSSVQASALATVGTDYYTLRAQELALEGTPFTAVGALMVPDELEAQQAAETWLRQWLSLGDDVAIRSLSAALAEDNRLKIGSKLWQLGLYEEAKRELEAVRIDYARDALTSYQLALYFRDLGLYRSSILAATAVINLSGQTVFDVPPFIGRLAYPIYYHELITPLAGLYGYDARLQFALVRQESLFESFARSGAAAQGLSQVIPDTGTYIAQRLGWPEYENEDLYRPYVGLAFGAYYLDEQLNSFEGQVYAALSAYNAGPGNARRWYEVAGDDWDLYVETVNFGETRLYIERIYTGYVIYRHLYHTE